MTVSQNSIRTLLSTRHKLSFGWGWIFLFCMNGCTSPSSEQEALLTNAAPKDVDSIVRFCADCHDLPKSSSFAKDRWPEEVEQGMRIYRQSARTDLLVPDFDATVAFFRENAPESLSIDPPKRVQDTRFVPSMIPWPGSTPPVSISSIRMLHGKGDLPKFSLSDMWTGAISLVSVGVDGSSVEEIGDVAHPAHVEPYRDIPGGGEGFLVADLGTLNPQVEKQGSVWLCEKQSDASFKLEALKLGLSRVADVRQIDYDNDEDMDLLIGDFGLHFVGSIFLGTRQSTAQQGSRYRWEVIDSRPGAISLPTIDFNTDGRMDFVALIAQQFESVELKLNQGDGRFETKVIYAAGDPSYGTSSMELVDFDQDGDFDVVYTNGDTFDDTLAKPYHSIKWLENKGTFPFDVHEVAEMPGCYKAVSGDIDGDGDLDLAAVAYLSDEEVAKYAIDTFDGVAWFEHQNDGVFVRHTVVKNKCRAATCALTDWDLDGDLDLVVPPSSAHHERSDGMSVYLNQTLPVSGTTR